jgi:hypothetical protein
MIIGTRIQTAENIQVHGRTFCSHQEEIDVNPVTMTNDLPLLLILYTPHCNRTHYGWLDSVRALAGKTQSEVEDYFGPVDVRGKSVY